MACRPVALALLLGAAMALDEVQSLSLDVDAEEVCPEKPVRMTISSEQPGATNLLAFQASFDDTELRLENTQRAPIFRKHGACPWSVFAAQPVANPTACTLPVSCMHGIAAATALRLKDAVMTGAELVGCSTNPLQTARYGWLIADATASQLGERCPASAAGIGAWDTDAFRGCARYVQAILEHPRSPYTKGLPRARVLQVLELLKPCTKTHQMNSVSFLCGSRGAEKVVPAAVAAAVQVWLRAPRSARTDGTTVVGVTINPRLVGEGLRYAETDLTKTLRTSAMCPAPVCAAGQRSTQLEGAWCGTGALRECCADCAAGYFSATAGANLCSACAPGTFAATARSTTCLPHRAPCEAGSYESVAPSVTSDRVCSSCDTHCAAGTHHAGCADLSAGSCVACPSGQFKPEASTFQCAFHTIPCAAGTFEDVSPSASRNRLCAPCAAGRYQNQKGQLLCIDVAPACSVGEYETAAPTATSDRQCAACGALCDAGFEKHGCGGTHAGICVSCARGRFKAAAGEDMCAPIGAPCDTGTHETAAPTTSSDRECSNCNTHCPAGKYHFGCTPTSRGSCVTCMAGTFKDTDGVHACAVHTVCPAGHFAAVSGSATSDSTCTACVTVCPAGQVHRHCAGASAGSCTACAAGRFKAYAGDAECVPHAPPCAPGTFMEQTPSAKAARVCTACPAGKHQMHANQPACDLVNTQSLQLAEAISVEACPNQPITLKVTSFQSDGQATDMLAFRVSWDVASFDLLDVRRTPALAGLCDTAQMMAIPPTTADTCELTDVCLAALATNLASHAGRLATADDLTRCTLAEGTHAGRQYGWALKDAVADAVGASCPALPGAAPATTAWLNAKYRACFPKLEKLIDVTGNPYMSNAKLVARVKPCLLHHQTTAVGFMCASKTAAPIIPAELKDVLEVDLRASLALQSRNTTIKAIMDPRFAGKGYVVRNPSLLATVQMQERCPAPLCQAGEQAARSDGLWCEHVAGGCCAPCAAGKFSATGTQCTNCATGRFQKLPGASSCRSVRGPCGSGSYQKMAPTASSDRICEGCNAKCPVGMHHVGCAEESAGTCEACPVGQYKTSVDAFHCTTGDVETLHMQLDSTNVCPGKPIKLSVTAATSHKKPVDMLAFQTFWDPAVLTVEDMQRNDTLVGKQCDISVFKSQKVVDWQACTLPESCLHGIASNIGQELHSRLYEHGEKHSQCTLSASSGSNFGWVLRNAIEPLIFSLNYDGSGSNRVNWSTDEVANEAARQGVSNRTVNYWQSPTKLDAKMLAQRKLRCPHIPHATPATAWQSPTLRACYGYIEQLFEKEGVPFMKHLPRYKSDVAVRLIKPCMTHTDTTAVAFVCGSSSGKAIVPAAVPQAVEVVFRAPLVLRTLGTTAVGMIANKNLSPLGLAYAPTRDVQHLKVSPTCPAPVCAAGQRSTQDGGVWCGANALKPCCKDCNPGEFSPFEGSNKCLACPSGQFQANPGQMFCNKVRAPCETGTYEWSAATATSNRVCASCDVNCAAGTHHRGCKDRSAGSCVACPAGRFKPSRSMFQCAFHSSESCPDGTFTVSGTARTDRVCKLCPGGAATCASPEMQRLSLQTTPESDASTPMDVCPNKPVSLSVTSAQSDNRPTDMLAFELSWDVNHFSLVDVRRTPALSGKCDVSLVTVLPPDNADACELSTACIASIALEIGSKAIRLGKFGQQKCTLSETPKAGLEFGWVLGEAVRDAIVTRERCPLPVGVEATNAWLHKSFRACYPTLDKLIDHPQNRFMPDPKLVGRVKPCLLHHQSTGIGFACYSKTGAPIIPAQLQDVLEVDLRSAFALDNGSSAINLAMDARLVGAGYSVLAEAASVNVTTANQCLAPVCKAGKYASTAYGLWCAHLRNGCCDDCPVGKFTDGAGAVACSVCPAGRFQHEVGKTGCADVRGSCLAENGRGSYEASAPTPSSDRMCKGCNSNCRPGTHHMGCGDRSAGACVACPSGHYKAAWGAYHCKPIPLHVCVAGKFRTFDIYDAHGQRHASKGAEKPVTGCVDCPAGKYTDKENQDACKAQPCCSAGNFMHATSNTASGTCTACPDGKYLATVRDKHCAGERCRDQPQTCPPRMQLDDASTTRPGSCQYCPAARFKPAADGTQCTLCPAGRFGRLNMRGMQDLHEACFACPAGQYQGEQGQSSCTTCAAGSFFDSAHAIHPGAGGISSAYCKPCTTTAWSAYGQCSKTCGIGRQTRTRVLSGAAALLADAQEQCTSVLTSDRVCNTHGCRNGECYHVKCRFSHDALGRTAVQVYHHHREPNIVHHCRVNELGHGAKSCSCVCSEKNGIVWMPALPQTSNLLESSLGTLARKSVAYTSMPLLKCELPDKCIHGIAHAIGDMLYQRTTQGQLGQCSLSRANAADYGWVLGASVASQYVSNASGTARCSAIAGVAPRDAWRADAVRGCLRYASLLLSNEYVTALGSNATAAKKRLLPCIETTPRSTGDWLVGSVSRNAFQRNETTYGVGFYADVMDASGRAIMGLQHGLLSRHTPFLNISHGFLINHDTIVIVEDGVVTPGSPRIARWDGAEDAILSSHLVVRVNHQDKVEYVVDGHIVYTSTAVTLFPLRAAGALFNSGARLKDVVWLDRRAQESASVSASLAAGNSDMVWDSLPGSAVASGGVHQLSPQAEDHFKAVWDAKVLAGNIEMPL